MDGGSAGFAGAIHRSIQLIYLGLLNMRVILRLPDYADITELLQFY
jgi:hypothetical protein